MKEEEELNRKRALKSASHCHTRAAVKRAGRRGNSKVLALMAGGYKNSRTEAKVLKKREQKSEKKCERGIQKKAWL